MIHFFRDLRKVPVLRVLIPLLAGIFLEPYISNKLLPCSLIVLALIFGCLAFLFRSHYQKEEWYSCFFFSAVFLLFIFAGYMHRKWSVVPSNSTLPTGSLWCSGTIREYPEEKEMTYSFAMHMDQLLIDDSVISVNQTVLVYLKTDSSLSKAHPGDRWVFRGGLTKIRNKGNPGEFDYAGFMKRKGIYYRLWVDPGCYMELSEDKHSRLKYLPGRISRMISKHWDHHDPDQAVLRAITIGDKSRISQDTRDAFSGSGAMHLLAVSGLHVGMIWWILDKLLVLPRRRKVFNVLKITLILAILWMYAGITGFSESVCRSVTMFSLISIARGISRNSNIYNTLFLSASILILIKPIRIEEPGFQLSYLAVLGIVSVHPLLVMFFPVSNKYLKRVSDLVFVSIAAQLATLPVSLLYFHTFPVYFILTNILAIPIVSILLALFVLFSPFFILDLYPEFFLGILTTLSGLLNLVVEGISLLPASKITNLPMEPPVCVLILLSLFTLCCFVIYRRLSWWIGFSLFAAAALGYSGALILTSRAAESIVIYNFRNCTALSTINRCEYVDYLFYSDSAADSYTRDYLEKRGKMSKLCENYRLQEIWVTNEYDNSELLNAPAFSHSRMYQITDECWSITASGKIILVVGGCSLEEMTEIITEGRWDIVLFRHGCPEIPLQLGKYFDGVQCIADGTMKRYELERIRALIPGLHNASQRGAWQYQSY